MVRVIIAGGRDFEDYHFLEKSVFSVVRDFNIQDIEFISGGAKGADYHGEIFCRTHQGKPPKMFRPEYVNAEERSDHMKHNKLAPLRRNRVMAEYAAGGILIAFLKKRVAPNERGGGQWQTGGGTWNMINNALAHEMNLYIFRY